MSVCEYSESAMRSWNTDTRQCPFASWRNSVRSVDQSRSGLRLGLLLTMALADRLPWNSSFTVG